MASQITHHAFDHIYKSNIHSHFSPKYFQILLHGDVKCVSVLHGRPQVELTGPGMTGEGREDSGTGGAASHAEIVLTFIILSQFLETEHFQENSFLISTRLGPELCNFNFIDF